MLSAPTALVRSESACCPGQLGVSPPVVRGSAECRHPLSEAAHSDCHPLSQSTPKIFLNQSPYKSSTRIKCPMQCCLVPRQTMTFHCPGRGRLGVKLKGQIMNLSILQHYKRPNINQNTLLFLCSFCMEFDSKICLASTRTTGW